MDYLDNLFFPFSSFSTSFVIELLSKIARKRDRKQARKKEIESMRERERDRGVIRLDATGSF